MSKKKLLILIAFILLNCLNGVFANDKLKYETYIEMYGANEEVIKSTMEKYGASFNQLVECMRLVSNNPDDRVNSEKAENLYKSISKKLKNEGFSFAKISSIMYPNEKKLYMTIDVVEKKDNMTRNTFNALPKQNVKDDSGLIEKWMEYDKKGWQLYAENKVILRLKDCPVNHCEFGFDHADLANYLTEFNTVDKYKKQVVKTLTEDKNPDKRSAAAFLIGHLNDPNEIVQLLTPSISDPEPVVRNNVLRVIVTTALKNENLSTPIDKISKAINDPAAENRGKALLILYELVKDNKKHHQYIKKNYGAVLLELLKLKQPSNHVGAFIVLKAISGKNYDQWDIASWQKWLTTTYN